MGVGWVTQGAGDQTHVRYMQRKQASCLLYDLFGLCFYFFPTSNYCVCQFRLVTSPPPHFPLTLT